MNMQLLLLLALAGPFCAFTHASPTEIPSDVTNNGMFGTTESLADPSVEVTSAPQDLDVISGPPPTDPPTAPEEVQTEAPTEAATEAATEAVTETGAPALDVTTEAPVGETEGHHTVPATEAPEQHDTEAPAVETAAPTDPPAVEPLVTETPEAETNGGVVVEEELDGGLTSGQVVGIVIGALLAVVVVIAVVIAVVRRMGKYSP